MWPTKRPQRHILAPNSTLRDTLSSSHLSVHRSLHHSSPFRHHVCFGIYPRLCSEMEDGPQRERPPTHGPSHRDADQSTEEHLGTLFQVKGSPLAGFTHEIRKNWNRQNDTGVESVHLLCQAESQHAPGDSMANGEIIQTALIVRPPGVTQPLWDAVSHFLFFVSTCCLSCD
jgi:hypothetical protein